MTITEKGDLNRQNNVEALIESKCAGKDCKRDAVRILQVKFIHKKGAFCERCSSELHALDLIENYSDKKALLAENKIMIQIKKIRTKENLSVVSLDRGNDKTNRQDCTTSHISGDSTQK